jgi:hypothetical protein
MSSEHSNEETGRQTRYGSARSQTHVHGNNSETSSPFAVVFGFCVIAAICSTTQLLDSARTRSKALRSRTDTVSGATVLDIHAVRMSCRCEAKRSHRNGSNGIEPIEFARRCLECLEVLEQRGVFLSASNQHGHQPDDEKRDRDKNNIKKVIG